MLGVVLLMVESGGEIKRLSTVVEATNVTASWFSYSIKKNRDVNGVKMRCHIMCKARARPKTTEKVPFHRLLVCANPVLYGICWRIPHVAVRQVCTSA